MGDQEKFIIEYDVNEAYILEETEKYKDIELIPDDQDSYAMVMAGLRAHRNIRLAIEKKRKSNGEAARAYIAANNARAKELHALNDPGEQRLKDIRQAEDDRLYEIKMAEQRAAIKRVEDIMAGIQKIKDLATGIDFLTAEALESRFDLIGEVPAISTGVYAEFSGQAAKALEHTVATVEHALSERKRLDKEDAERKVEAERLERIRFEQEEAQKKIDAENARQEEEKRKIRAEQDRLEAEKRAEQERKDREAFEAKAKEEARIKVEKDAKEKAEREERERVEREQREKEAAARQEALKPDKQKVKDWVYSIKELVTPEIDDEHLRDILETAIEDIEIILQNILEDVEAE